MIIYDRIMYFKGFTLYAIIYKVNVDVNLNAIVIRRNNYEI